MYARLHARPQLNGNTEADFGEAYVALRDAMDAIDHAASMLSSNVLNSRNYQHFKRGEDFRRGEDMSVEDRRRVHAALRQARGILGTLCSDICDALEEETV